MANHKDALKRDRQSKKQRQLNRAMRAELRTSLKQTRDAAAGNDPQVASQALRSTQSLLHRLASKGVIHANRADRLIGRLAAATSSSSESESAA